MSSEPPIQELCDAEIASISVEEHVAGSERSLVSIYLELRGRAGLRIRGAPDGWGLSAGSDPPQAYDMGEYGCVEIRPATEKLGSATGKVATLWTVHAPEDVTPVGVRWRTATGADVVVYAYDDTLLVAAPDALELGGVTFTEVC